MCEWLSEEEKISSAEKTDGQMDGWGKCMVMVLSVDQFCQTMIPEGLVHSFPFLKSSRMTSLRLLFQLHSNVLNGALKSLSWP